MQNNIKDKPTEQTAANRNAPFTMNVQKKTTNDQRRALEPIPKGIVS